MQSCVTGTQCHHHLDLEIHTRRAWLGTKTYAATTMNTRIDHQYQGKSVQPTTCQLHWQSVLHWGNLAQSKQGCHATSSRSTWIASRGALILVLCWSKCQLHGRLCTLRIEWESVCRISTIQSTMYRARRQGQRPIKQTTTPGIQSNRRCNAKV